MMNKTAVVLMIWMVCNQASSQSFSVVGEVFQVTEESFLQLIQTRLEHLTESGELDEINQRWQKQVESHANRPTPLKLPRAVRKQTHYFRPEIVLDTSITDASGQVIYPAGTKVNALSRLSYYSPCWLFLNGEDVAEQKWAQKEMSICSNPKIILTGGSVHEIEVLLNTAIYFDQGGVLTQKLGIHATPSRVTRHRDALKIEELVIKEDGDVL